MIIEWSLNDDWRIEYGIILHQEWLNDDSNDFRKLFLRDGMTHLQPYQLRLSILSTQHYQFIYDKSFVII